MNRSNSTISIPNLLTLVRILLTPVLVILLLRDLFHLALLVFFIAGLSDGLDGLIARLLNQRTKLGAYLDPAADKLLLTSAFVTLAALQVIPAWLTVIVFARDVIIVMGLAIFTLTEKPYEINPTMLSKCTTTIQLAMVLLSLFDPVHTKIAVLHSVLVWSTAAFTILSGLHYIVIGMNILQEPGNQRNNAEHP